VSYIDQNLMAGERVVARARLNWVVFMWPIVFVLFGLITSSTPFCFVWFGLAAITALGAILAFATSEFALTDRRVIAKTGAFHRKSFELLLGKIEGIQVDQGVHGRLWGYGTIVITGTGGSRNVFKRISSPLEFRRQVQEQLARGGPA
jgi:uncharacterized membrane protein YdbT with pleckstrin-like domain